VTKTYDEKCLALAAHFMADWLMAVGGKKGELRLDRREATTHRLAIEIQCCIEDFLAGEEEGELSLNEEDKT